ncbi:hypothetical protein [Desulfosporosinus fructosivorans]|nr:hypothetical protein [Desulfosporosinus fructosivorans]
MVLRMGFASALARVVGSWETKGRRCMLWGAGGLSQSLMLDYG